MTDYLTMKSEFDGREIPPSLLARFDEARSTWALEVASAVEALAEEFSFKGTADDVARSLSCNEVEALSTVLHRAGFDAEADRWLNSHIEADYDLTADEVREAHGVDVDRGPSA